MRVRAGPPLWEGKRGFQIVRKYNLVFFIHCLQGPKSLTTPIGECGKAGTYIQCKRERKMGNFCGEQLGNTYTNTLWSSKSFLRMYPTELPSEKT